jgi:hypothetical protein
MKGICRCGYTLSEHMGRQAECPISDGTYSEEGSTAEERIAVLEKGQAHMKIQLDLLQDYVNNVYKIIDKKGLIDTPFIKPEIAETAAEYELDPRD